MNSQEISNYLNDNKIKPMYFFTADANYSIPTKKWFLNEFSKSLVDHLIKIGIFRYAAESNDCDDYSRFAATLAQIFNAKSGRSDKGLSIGEVWYIKNGNLPHAITIAIVANKGNYEICFMEPQSGKQEILSQKEIESIYYVRF